MSNPAIDQPRGLRLFGVGIHIDASWLIFAAFIAWQITSGYFPELEGLSRSAYWTVAALVVVGLSLSILLHEMAHTLAGRAMGMRIDRIRLYMFGGVAELRHEPRTALSEMLMALAGPIMSVVVSFGLRGVSTTLQGGTAPVELMIALDYLADLNLVLAIFNMIPAFPLDGGRVLRSAIWMVSGRVGFATRIAASIGQGLGLLLMAYAVYLLVRGQWGAGSWNLLLGMLLVQMAAMGKRAAPQD